MFVFMPAASSGKAYKLSRPFHGPYHVIRVHENGVEVRPVDQPRATTIRVALNRVRRCPREVPDTFWPRKGDRQRVETCDDDPPGEMVPAQDESAWSSRLRPRTRTS